MTKPKSFWGLSPIHVIPVLVILLLGVLSLVGAVIISMWYLYNLI